MQEMNKKEVICIVNHLESKLWQDLDMIFLNMSMC